MDAWMDEWVNGRVNGQWIHSSKRQMNSLSKLVILKTDTDTTVYIRHGWLCQRAWNYRTFKLKLKPKVSVVCFPKKEIHNITRGFFFFILAKTKQSKTTLLVNAPSIVSAPCRDPMWSWYVRSQLKHSSRLRQPSNKRQVSCVTASHRPNDNHTSFSFWKTKHLE